MLLRELACAGNVADATLSAQATPLLHALTAAHAYIMMFVHTCRVGQVRTRGEQVGLKLVKYLRHILGILLCLEAVLPGLAAKRTDFCSVNNIGLCFRLLSSFALP